MNLALPALLGLALVPSLTAQVVRPELAVDNSADVALGSSIDTEGDLTALAYVDAETLDLYVVTSDADGIDWSAPTQINSTTATWGSYGPLFQQSVHVVGDQILVAWLSTGNLRYNRFDGTSWTGEQIVDYGTVPGAQGIVEWHVDVDEGSLGVNVVFAIGIRAFQTPSSVDQVVVVSSQDGGVTLGSPTSVITTAAGRHLRDVDVAVDGDDAYVAWIDDRAGSFADLYLQKSTDGGATWDGFSSEKRVNSVLLNENEVNDGFDLHARGGVLALTWKEERPGTGSGANSVDRQFAAVSVDGGSSLPTETFLGFAGDQGVPAVEVLPNGSVVALWAGRLGDSGARVARFDSGVWGSSLELAPSPGVFPQLESDSLNNVHVSMHTGQGPQYAYSFDGGVSYSAPIPLGQSASFLYADFAYNESSETVMASWPNLVVGSLPDFPFSYEYSTDVLTGGVYMCDAAQVLHRNGGDNLDTYVAEPAVLGQPWSATVASLPGYGHALLFAYESAANLPFGTEVVLVDVSSPLIFLLGGIGLSDHPVRDPGAR